MEDIVVLTDLPCGKQVNLSAGECCLLNCPDERIMAEQNLRDRCWLVADCQHWQGRALLAVKERVVVSCQGCEKSLACMVILAGRDRAAAHAASLRKKCPEAPIKSETFWSADNGNTWRPRAEGAK